MKLIKLGCFGLLVMFILFIMSIFSEFQEAAHQEKTATPTASTKTAPTNPTVKTPVPKRTTHEKETYFETAVVVADNEVASAKALANTCLENDAQVCAITFPYSNAKSNYKKIYDKKGKALIILDRSYTGKKSWRIWRDVDIEDFKNGIPYGKKSTSDYTGNFDVTFVNPDILVWPEPYQL